MEKVVMVMLLVVTVARASEGMVHKVGGSAGWTILGNVDYSKWASSDTFHVGDSLLFVYNSQFHNVKQVSRQDFLSCKASSAMATYTTGNDTVALTKPGHYYYLCGFPGHCQAGQKLHVLVTPLPSGSALPPAPSPSAAVSPSSSAAASAPEVSAQSGAVTLWGVSRVMAAAVSGLVVSFM